MAARLECFIENLLCTFEKQPRLKLSNLAVVVLVLMYMWSKMFDVQITSNQCHSKQYVKSCITDLFFNVNLCFFQHQLPNGPCLIAARGYIYFLYVISHRLDDVEIRSLCLLAKIMFGNVN